MPSATKSRSSAKKATSSAKKKSSSSSRSSASKSSSSKREPRVVKDGGAIADKRAVVGARNAGVQAGKVDNMTRRSASDAIEGHFVNVDHTATGVSKEVKDLLGGVTGYGIYVEAAEVDAGGFPTQAIVDLRDSSRARIVVPYAALSPADPNRRG